MRRERLRTEALDAMRHRRPRHRSGPNLSSHGCSRQLSGLRKALHAPAQDASCEEWAGSPWRSSALWRPSAIVYAPVTR